MAYQKWREDHDAVFIKSSAKWSLLGSAEQLGIRVIFSEELYSHFIFPHFYKMDSDERCKHLEHIRDFMYQSMKVNSEIKPYNKMPQYLLDKKNIGLLPF